MRIRLAYVGILLFVLTAASCPPSSPFITTHLSVPRLSDSQIDNLRNGSLSFGDPNLSAELERSRCLFAVDFPNSPGIIFRANGDPGQAGFNVELTAPTIQAVTSSNFPCDQAVIPLPTAMTLQSGRNLSIGVPLKAGSLTVETGSGKFSTVPQNHQAGYIEFTLDSFNRNNNRAAGNFRFIARRDCPIETDAACIADNRLVFGVGSFLVPIH